MGLNQGFSTAGARELGLKARAPARFNSWSWVSYDPEIRLDFEFQIVTRTARVSSIDGVSG